uniref:NOT2/NOT3/NOT5 C-terminal domain-containing protein n=1 Tax=Ditylenchus dipsaci TaxID=166011 RepID=A0A915DLS6_9BILA
MNGWPPHIPATIESDPNIVALALGYDLTNLGLNLNSSKRNLYQTFGGPWAEVPCRIQDLDVYQVAAASELFQRDWRFHKVDRVWLRSPSGSHPREHTGSYEKSSYNVFDPVQWRKIPKKMILEYKQLEGRPTASIAAAAPTSTLNNNTTKCTRLHLWTGRIIISTDGMPPPLTTAEEQESEGRRLFAIEGCRLAAPVVHCCSLKCRRNKT